MDALGEEIRALKDGGAQNSDPEVARRVANLLELKAELRALEDAAEASTPDAIEASIRDEREARERAVEEARRSLAESPIYALPERYLGFKCPDRPTAKALAKALAQEDLLALASPSPRDGLSTSAVMTSRRLRLSTPFVVRLSNRRVPSTEGPPVLPATPGFVGHCQSSRPTFRCTPSAPTSGLHHTASFAPSHGSRSRLVPDARPAMCSTSASVVLATLPLASNLFGYLLGKTQHGTTAHGLPRHDQPAVHDRARGLIGV